MGDSEALDVGAASLGSRSPFGLQSTITSGIVSAKHRAGDGGQVYQDFLHNRCRGQSGQQRRTSGRRACRVVGINTAILAKPTRASASRSQQCRKEVFQRLKTKGQIARGWLGVQLREVRDEDVQQRGLPDNRGGVHLGGD